MRVKFYVTVSNAHRHSVKLLDLIYTKIQNEFSKNPEIFIFLDCRKYNLMLVTRPANSLTQLFSLLFKLLGQTLSTHLAMSNLQMVSFLQ